MSTRIGILGGTFNPPHIGHIRGAQIALRELKLDEILLIPANIPPHKVLPDDTASSADRLKMTEIASAELPRHRVSDMEIRRGGASFTVDTLTELRTRFGDEAELWLIMGTDMFLTLDRWVRADEIMRLAKIAVLRRDAPSEKVLHEKKTDLENRFSADITILDEDCVEISSTELRKILRSGQKSGLIDGCVLDYIRKNHLYGL